MKKTITLIMALVLATFALPTAYASSEYSTQLEELNALLAQCENKGISVPYEKVGVTTFERFIEYLADDEFNGVEENIMTYNRDAMQTLYSDTKANLTAYLSGEKTPAVVPEYDMMNTSVSGMGITDGKNNIISSGYGHFETVRNDIENLHDFGMMNIQQETGPDDIISLPEWSWNTAGSPEYYFDVVNDGSDKALKLSIKSEKATGRYFRFRQSVNVKPNTRYYYKMSYKGKNVSSDCLSIRINDGKTASKDIKTINETWTDTGWLTFVTGSDTTSVTLSVYLSEMCEELYVDDIIVSASEGGENLLKNGDFESEYSTTEVGKILSYLERAKQSNVAVSFLLQPLYFWRIPGCEDMYLSNTTELYNINDPRAKEKIEKYLRIIVPIIAECDSVRDICLTNEPNFDTRKFPDFYNPEFRDYLIGMYGSLAEINSKYKKSYSDITDITMPSSFEKSALFYDWICFNEDMLTEWNAWIASIVKEYTDKPVESKVMNYLLPSETEDRKELAYGADMEKFAAFCDYAGNDASNSLNWTPTMVTKMMWYDYLYSVVKKPVYNMEDHFISDGSREYSVAQKNNVRYNLWQGAVHGRTITTMWVWERTHDSSSALYGSILTRPDCVAEAGYTSYDMMRNANDIIKLSSKKPEVALFYSKTSRVYTDDYMKYLARYYEALLYSGKRVGFVTETSLENLSDYEYLVIPYVKYTTPETLEAVNKFIDSGKKVIYYAEESGWFLNKTYECMTKDKFGNSLDNSKIKNSGKRFTSKDISDVVKAFQDYFSNERVRVVDSSNKNTRDVEYEYVIDDDAVLVNMVYLNAGTKTVSVKLDGQKLSGMKNIVTGETMGDTYTLTGYVPLTLKLKRSTEIPSVPQNIKYSGNMISWDDDDKASSYNVYYIDNNGDEVLYEVTENNYCAVSEYGIYKVVAVNSQGESGAPASVTVLPPLDIEFNAVEFTGNGVNASVKVINTYSTAKKATIKIKTAEGKVAMSTIWIPANESRDFSASITGVTECVTAVVCDAVSGEIISSVNYEK